MYSEIWLPDLLDSEKWLSSLFSIRLNCNCNISIERVTLIARRLIHPEGEQRAHWLSHTRILLHIYYNIKKTKARKVRSYLYKLMLTTDLSHYVRRLQLLSVNWRRVGKPALNVDRRRISFVYSLYISRFLGTIRASRIIFFRIYRESSHTAKFSSRRCNWNIYIIFNQKLFYKSVYVEFYYS